jgi:small subunit ribosomal protein S2
MDLLIPHEKYLEAGVHIGTRAATREMRKFVYKFRKDKLSMLNIEQIDKRIRECAKILAQFEPGKIAIIASRVYAIPAAKKFAELTGANLYTGRFVPGTFTNPSRSNFSEPKVIFVCDPRIERQALIESTSLGVPTMGLADTDNTPKYLDYFVPCNNKGKRSVPLVFYLLAREFLKAKGKTDEEITFTPEEFELGESGKIPEGTVVEGAGVVIEGEAVEEPGEEELGAEASDSGKE